MENKRIGGEAEAIFIAKGVSLGFVVNRPFIDTHPYDFLLDREGKFTRVQVKSCFSEGQKYGANLCKGSTKRAPYTAKEIDVFALYVPGLNIFYIIPIKDIEGIKKISLYPDGDSKYNTYKDNWGIIDEL